VLICFSNISNTGKLHCIGYFMKCDKLLNWARQDHPCVLLFLVVLCSFHKLDSKTCTCEFEPERNHEQSRQLSRNWRPTGIVAVAVAVLWLAVAVAGCGCGWLQVAG
jgi:hypothetical protein